MSLLRQGYGLDPALHSSGSEETMPSLSSVETTSNRYAVIGWDGDYVVKGPYTRTYLDKVWNSAPYAADLLNEYVKKYIEFLYCTLKRCILTAVMEKPHRQSK